MGKRLLAYLVIAAAIAGVAYLVAARFIGGDDGEASPTPAAAAAAPAGGEPQEAAPASAGVAGVKVLEVVGSVTRSGAAGAALAVAAGDTLAVDDALVTGPESRVRLEVGARSSVDLSERAEVRVRELSESMQRLGLVYGRASVDYKEDGRVLRIENADGSAVAQVKKGKFSILSTGTTVAVATETGQVDLSAAGATVEVTADRQSVVAGGVPTRPLAVPPSLVLRVADPGCRVQREAFYVVNGRTSPGARVFVNDIEAKVGGDGGFSLRLPLKIGKNRIVVATVDVAGREERRVFSCVTVDPGAPIQGVDIKWGAGKKGGG